MAGFELSTWINSQPESIFTLLSDTTKAPKIMKNISRLEKLTEGPVKVGTKFLETRVVKGEEHQTELEVTICEPYSQYGVTAEAEGIAVNYIYTLKPENEGTQVHLQCNVDSNGLKKLMLPVVASFMKKEDGDHLQALKTFAES